MVSFAADVPALAGGGFAAPANFAAPFVDLAGPPLDPLF